MGRKRILSVDVRQAQKFAKGYRECTIDLGGSDSLCGMNELATHRSHPWYLKVRQRLDDTGMSYAQLANRLTLRGFKTAKSTVGAWMKDRNQPRLEIIMEVGEIIGMSLSEIVSEDLYFVRDPLTRQIVERLDGMNDDKKRAILELLGPPPTEEKIQK